MVSGIAGLGGDGILVSVGVPKARSGESGLSSNGKGYDGIFDTGEAGFRVKRFESNGS